MTYRIGGPERGNFVSLFLVNEAEKRSGRGESRLMDRTDEASVVRFYLPRNLGRRGCAAPWVVNSNLIIWLSKRSFLLNTRRSCFSSTSLPQFSRSASKFRRVCLPDSSQPFQNRKALCFIRSCALIRQQQLEQRRFEKVLAFLALVTQNFGKV